MPLPTQRIEELVALARDHYGLEVDSTMTEDRVRSMIEAAKGGPDARETKVTGPEESKPASASETKRKKPARR